MESKTDWAALAAADAAADAADAKRKADEKAERKQRIKLVRPNGQTKSTDRSKVWPASAIGSVRATSFNGKVLLALQQGPITMADWERLGLPSKRQLSQAIASISEKGYGIEKNGDQYTLILPDGLDAPKVA